MLRRYRCACYGWIGLLLAAVGQLLTVQFNYEGDPSALFYTGRQTTIPPSLGEEPYRAPDARGFDGQFYHLIAHDPFLGKGYASSVDNPRLRWRRILVPLGAFLLAFGRSGWIDAAYILLTAGFVLLGTYWLARLAQDRGLHPACGLLFLTLPAVFMSLERMTVDVALAALTVGFVMYLGSPGWKLFAVLAAAPLARETGLILIAGCCGCELLRRNWRGLMWYTASGLPYAAWAGFVHWRTAPDATAWGASFPFSGLWQRTMDPFPYEITGAWVAAAAVGDYLGILTMWICIAAAFVVVRKRSDALAMAGVGFVLLAALLGKADVWAEAYGFSRIFTPWFVLLAVAGVESRSKWMLAPWVLNFPRVAVQAWIHAPGIVAGLLCRR